MKYLGICVLGYKMIVFLVFVLMSGGRKFDVFVEYVVEVIFIKFFSCYFLGIFNNGFVEKVEYEVWIVKV